MRTRLLLCATMALALFMAPALAGPSRGITATEPPGLAYYQQTPPAASMGLSLKTRALGVKEAAISLGLRGLWLGKPGKYSATFSVEPQIWMPCMISVPYYCPEATATL